MLVVVGGLPASGKTALSRAAARLTGAVHLRIDTIEQAVVDAGVARHPVGAVGYVVGYALAGDFLAQGLTVLADCVNPVATTRAAWRAVAAAGGRPVLEVEVVCSDPVEHRRRAETRTPDIPGLPAPDWGDIEAREYEPWTGHRLVLDTGTSSVAAAADELARAVWPIGT